MKPVLSPFFPLLYIYGGNSGLLPLQTVSKSIIVLFLASVVLLRTVMTLDQSSPALSTTSMTREATTTLPNTGIRSSCNSQSCSSQENVPCKINVFDSLCVISYKQRNHFPNRPRDLNISHTVVGNRRLFNITWKPPYDYSYKVLDGFELILYIRRNRSIDFPECIFFNLSGINWTEVEDIHDVLFFFDCWHEGASTELDLHMRLYSTPLPDRQALFASRNLSLAGGC